MNSEIVDFFKKLPSGIFSTVIKYIDTEDLVTEIRLRKNRNIVLTTLDGKITTTYRVSDDELNKCVFAICDGSLHAHDETIADGYISCENGIRVGICGRAVTKNNTVSAVYDFSSVNIRIPRSILGIGNAIVQRIKNNAYNESVLIYSAPGVGKTTLIRDISRSLAAFPHNLKVGIIDSRCEIADKALYNSENADIFENYPKAKAIEIAVRTMSCEYLVCDEIGSYDEAKSLLSVQNSGVPVIATAHADNVIDLLMRPNIRILHEACCFDTYIGVKRVKDKMKFSFTSRDEII